MGEVKEFLNLLGMKGKDKVTGYEGVISSVVFDLYGCIQLAINPGKGKDGKLLDTAWFDSNRIEVTGKKRVMDLPGFATNDKGPETSRPVIN